MTAALIQTDSEMERLTIFTKQCSKLKDLFFRKGEHTNTQSSISFNAATFCLYL